MVGSSSGAPRRPGAQPAYDGVLMSSAAPSSDEELSQPGRVAIPTIKANTASNTEVQLELTRRMGLLPPFLDVSGCVSHFSSSGASHCSADHLSQSAPWDLGRNRRRGRLGGRLGITAIEIEPIVADGPLAPRQHCPSQGDRRPTAECPAQPRSAPAHDPPSRLRRRIGKQFESSPGQATQSVSRFDRKFHTSKPPFSARWKRGSFTTMMEPTQAAARLRQTSRPATQPVMKLASEPESIERRPSCATSERRFGASPPIPPSRMAREPKLAKPHSA